MQQIDVKTVFLNSTLEDEFFIEQPLGFESVECDVCMLNKSIMPTVPTVPTYAHSANFTSNLGQNRDVFLDSI